MLHRSRVLSEGFGWPAARVPGLSCPQAELNERYRPSSARSGLGNTLADWPRFYNPVHYKKQGVPEGSPCNCSELIQDNPLFYKKFFSLLQEAMD